MDRILVINSGSSSIKFSLYGIEDREELRFSGRIERIGLSGSPFRVIDANAKVLLDRHQDLPDHDAALKALTDWMQADASGGEFHAVGHRVVHGGRKYREPHAVTPDL